MKPRYSLIHLKIRASDIWKKVRMDSEQTISSLFQMRSPDKDNICKVHELVAQEPGWVGQTLLDTIRLMQWVIFAGSWCHNPLPLQTALHQPLNPSQPNCICRTLTCQWPITLIIPSNDFGLRGQTIKKQQLKRMSWVRIKTPVPSGCLPHFWGGKSNIFLAVYKEMRVIFIF